MGASTSAMLAEICIQKYRTQENHSSADATQNCRISEIRRRHIDNG